MWVVITCASKIASELQLSIHSGTGNRNSRTLSSLTMKMCLTIINFSEEKLSINGHVANLRDIRVSLKIDACHGIQQLFSRGLTFDCTFFLLFIASMQIFAMEKNCECAAKRVCECVWRKNVLSFMMIFSLPSTVQNCKTKILTHVSWKMCKGKILHAHKRVAMLRQGTGRVCKFSYSFLGADSIFNKCLMVTTVFNSPKLSLWWN